MEGIIREHKALIERESFTPQENSHPEAVNLGAQLGWLVKSTERNVKLGLTVNVDGELVCVFIKNLLRRMNPY